MSEQKTVTFEGSIIGTVTVPVGTKMKDAARKVKPEIVLAQFSMRDSAGKPVSFDREIRDDLKVSVTPHAMGS